MHWTSKLAAAVLATLLIFVAAPAIAEPRPPVTILISIDGFRADYLDRGKTPVLAQLAASGISAAMRPSFPTKTYPNHWTLVTGLRPDRNGIVANTMEAPELPGVRFSMDKHEDPAWWNEAEPIWVTAEKAGIRTASMFWPGQDVAWGGKRDAAWPNDVHGGVRPQDWWPFGLAVDNRQRVDGVIDWLRRPAATRPAFVALYFDTVDTAGHQDGPDSPGLDRALVDIDAAIGRLVAELKALDQPANLVIVADHGMAATSPERVVTMDQLADPADWRLLEGGPFATVYPVAGREAALEKALLAPHAHVQCWRRAEIPARFHYGANPRVAPYFCLAETGWIIAKNRATKEDDVGNHGYDDMAPEMAALFIASGPAFRAAGRLPGFDNVDVAPLLRDLLHLPVGKDLAVNDAPFVKVLIAPRK